ncbi:Quinolinate synthetase, partial [hydrothermal vent metagenome]
MSIPLTGNAGPGDAELVEEINRLRKTKNAVILAHYYQDGRIQ